MSAQHRIALYFHWPFCLAKCPYCDFNSHVRDGIDTAAWRSALLQDLTHEAALLPNAEVGSVFFGGGTPSLMPPGLVAELIDAVGDHWPVAPNCEITLEANPSSVEAAKFESLALAGVNRVSLGVQSFDNAVLRMLGRLHDSAEAIAALEIAQRSFSRVSFDLIYARPGQSPSDWQTELDHALSFGTEHLSLYQLTIEPGTRFATDVRRGELIPLDDDAAADMFSLTRDITSSAGLPAYEISNHARPGCESRHNLTYWRYGDYVGVGPGAHGRRAGLATERHRKPENYLAAIAKQGSGLSVERALPAREQAEEALMMGLRLAEGIDLAALSDRFAIPADHLVDMRKLAIHQENGLFERAGSRIAVTDRGMPVLDALLGEIIASERLPA
ncbi:radical SAM family heme chaperone HemW [Qipengyuania sp.]|uniref:radical SAM family heme chaperone HemW n=1 Tax=Qipengyuania sp. TaxID=2004515 RepID=UPI0035C7B4CE